MPIPRLQDETAEPQSLHEIRDWHRCVADSLVIHRGEVLRAIRDHSLTAPRFIGLTEEEVHVYFEAQRRELDRLTVLNLVASAEAAIRIDFYRRVKNRLKDTLSRAYRKWFKKLSGKKQLCPDFDEKGILHVLKKSEIMDNQTIGLFRECLQARHWVGHGRFWAKPVTMDRLDPDDVYSRANAVLQALSN
jgi:hypothetical protein